MQDLHDQDFRFCPVCPGRPVCPVCRVSPGPMSWAVLVLLNLGNQ